MPGQRVGFRPKFAGSEADGEIEGREILGPASLTAREHLGGREVLQVLVVGDNVDTVLGAFEVVSPDFEALEYGEELFVVRVIIALGFGEGMGVECDGVNLAIGRDSGDDASECIVGRIGLDKHGAIGGPMGEDRGFRKGLLEGAERGIGLVRPVPGSALACQACQQDYDVRVVEYKSAIEVCKAKERLNLLDCFGGWPLEN